MLLHFMFVILCHFSLFPFCFILCPVLFAAVVVSSCSCSFRFFHCTLFYVIVRPFLFSLYCSFLIVVLSVSCTRFCYVLLIILFHLIVCSFRFFNFSYVCFSSCRLFSVLVLSFLVCYIIVFVYVSFLSFHFISFLSCSPLFFFVYL